jgi:hypothetical protein
MQEIASLRHFLQNGLEVMNDEKKDTGYPYRRNNLNDGGC